MPIYAYKCESCGHRQDVLQKVSDPALHTCPACAAPTFAKQVTCLLYTSDAADDM
jgi:putative FmdB family regulatory protein